MFCNLVLTGFFFVYLFGFLFGFFCGFFFVFVCFLLYFGGFFFNWLVITFAEFDKHFLTPLWPVLRFFVSPFSGVYNCMVTPAFGQRQRSTVQWMNNKDLNSRTSLQIYAP